MLDLLISYMNLFIISLSYIIKRLTFQPPNPPGYVIHKNTKNNKEEIFFLVQSKKQNRYEKKQFNGINIEYINLFNKIKIKAELLLIKPHKHFPICIIYCHGNCGDIGYALYDCYLLAKNTNCIVLSFEFPSYGILKDLPFSEINTYKSIQIAYIYANKFLNINAKNIILYGFSLGTGIAFDLACKKKFPIGGLILQSPYLSIFRVVYDGKKSPFFDIFKNCDKAHKLKALTLFIHGNKDKIVPYVHGRILAKIIPSKYLYDFLTINGGDHLDLFVKDDETIFNKIKEFIGFLCSINLDNFIKNELKLDNYTDFYDPSNRIEKIRNNKVYRSISIKNISNTNEENLIEETKSQSTLNKNFEVNTVIKCKSLKKHEKKSKSNLEEAENRNETCVNLKENDFGSLNMDNNSSHDSLSEQQSNNANMNTKINNKSDKKKNFQKFEIEKNNKSFSVFNKPVKYYNEEI